MELESILEDVYERSDSLGTMYTSGLEMYTGIGGPKGPRPISGIGGLGSIRESRPFRGIKGINDGYSGFDILKDKKENPYGIIKNSIIEGVLERVRNPETDKTHGFHVNYEEIVPGIKKPLINLHINLNEED